MRLRDLLPREHIVVPLEATTVLGALDELIAVLARHGAVREAAPLAPLSAQAALRGTVAIGERAILPHLRTEAVDRLVIALGVAASPLDPADSGIELRPRVAILVLAPVETATLYLQTVSSVARVLRQPVFLERLLAAASPDAVLALLDVADVRIEPGLAVRDVMAPATVRIGPDADLQEAVDLMVRRQAALIPVVGEKGEVLGTVGERDIMRALLPQVPRAGQESTPAEGAALSGQKVRDVMTRSVLCVSEDMALEEAAGILINKDVVQLPVVREGALAGILGRGDVIRKLLGR